MYHSTYSDRKGEWLDIFMSDKNEILEIMVDNMTSDFEHGYDYFGKSIQEQIAMINEYKAKFDAEMESFKTMTPEQVNHWCFIDLKKRGAIL